MATRIVILLLLFTVSALGGASSAAAGLPRHHRVPIPGGRGHRPIAGWAFIGRHYELSHATVSLWTLSGRRIPGGSTRTGRTGVFTLSPSARVLPRRFVVTVQGGSIAGHRQPGSFAFSALVDRRALGRIVFVGLASTVLRDYLLAHPRVSEATASRRVRRMLGIPAWHDLGFDLYNISARWYSAARVMHAAAAHRGMKKLVSALVRAAQRGGTAKRPPFEGSVPRGVAAFGGPSDQAFVDRGASKTLGFAGQGLRPHQAGVAAFGGEWFLQQLASGVISASAGQGAGWAFNEIGFSPTPAYVSQIQSQLNKLAAQMSELKDAIYNLNAAVQATYYASLNSSLNDARSAIDTAMGDMTWIANDTNDADRAYWAQRYFDQDITPVATGDDPWKSTLALFNIVLVSPGTGVYPLGLQSAIYIKSEGHFWTLTKSEQMFQTVDFWTQYAVEWLDIYLEYEHAPQIAGQDHCTQMPLTDANCPLQKTVDDTQTLGNQTLATLHDPQGRPLKPLPTWQSGGGPVKGYTIDIRSGLMWCTPCAYLLGGSAVPFATARSSLASGYYLGQIPLGIGDYGSNTPFIFYKDFAVPNPDQLGGLMQDCGCDSSHPTGVQWLVNNGVIDPGWLYADQTYYGYKPANPGYVYMWTSAPGPNGFNLILDLKTDSPFYGGGGQYGGGEYYLPARTPTASEGPYYP